MRVDFERLGGFAGLRLVAQVDVDTLPPQEAQELKDLIDAAGFFNLPSTIRSTQNVDQFTYKVSVTTPETQHSVTVSEGAVSEALRPLLERLTTIARTTPKS
jgi:hypothetical protein